MPLCDKMEPKSSQRVKTASRAKLKKWKSGSVWRSNPYASTKKKLRCCDKKSAWWRTIYRLRTTRMWKWLTRTSCLTLRTCRLGSRSSRKRTSTCRNKCLSSSGRSPSCSKLSWSAPTRLPSLRSQLVSDQNIETTPMLFAFLAIIQQLVYNSKF